MNAMRCTDKRSLRVDEHFPLSCALETPPVELPFGAAICPLVSKECSECDPAAIDVVIYESPSESWVEIECSQRAIG